MLAFLDSPVQLIFAAVVILVVFGPQKLPEIANQIGRALRELKRTTSDLQESMRFDDHNNYQAHYNPPSYDSYGNPTTSLTSDTSGQTASVPEEDVRYTSPSAISSYTGASEGQPHGDFAASALSDTSSDYGIGLSTPAVPAVETEASGINYNSASAAREISIRPAEGAMPRQS